jgi:hypothetical protein
VGEREVSWLVGVDGSLQVSWLNQVARFNEDKTVNLTWHIDKDTR